MRNHGYKKCMKGKFRPRNPGKYRGNVKEIIYRSQGELYFMHKLDENEEVISWASEEMSLPYYNPMKKRTARYFPDFILMKKDKEGKNEVVMVEMKMIEDTRPPVRKGKMEVYMKKMIEWTINQAKWKAAIEFCQRQKPKMRFVVVARDNNFKFHELNESQLPL